MLGRVEGPTGGSWPDPSVLPHNKQKGGWRGLQLSEKQAEALGDFREAYAALNHEASLIIWYVVLIGVDIGLYEQVGDGSRAWRKGYGMTRLREALDDLVRFYKNKQSGGRSTIRL